MQTTTDIINLLGGNPAVARLTGRNTKAVWAWRTLPTFPSSTFLVMKAALEERGIAANPNLWGMTPPQDEAA